VPVFTRISAIQRRCLAEHGRAVHLFFRGQRQRGWPDGICFGCTAVHARPHWM